MVLVKSPPYVIELDNSLYFLIKKHLEGALSSHIIITVATQVTISVNEHMYMHTEVV